MIESIVQVLLYAAGIFAVLGAIGMLRFPDFFTRTHAATLLNVGGIILALVSMLLLAISQWSAYSWKIVFIIFLLLIANPTNTHVIANAAFRIGIKPKVIKGGKK